MLEKLLLKLYGTMCYKWPVKELFGGEFKIENGSIALPFLPDGQYFRIVGSAFNDGVYKYPAQDLTDETFRGAVWTLNIHPGIVELAEKIEKWQAENQNAANSPYQSESFGGYSYTLKSGANGRAEFGWEDKFASEIALWRKI